MPNGKKKKVALKAPKSMPIAPKAPKRFLYHGAEGAEAKMGLHIGKRQVPLKIGGKTLKRALKMGVKPLNKFSSTFFIYISPPGIH